MSRMPPPSDAPDRPPLHAPTPAAPPDAAPRSSRWATAVAWIVILLIAGLMVAGNAMPAPSTAGGTADRVGSVLIKMQGRYLVGAEAAFSAGSTGQLWASSREMLNTGSIAQRLRVAVLGAEFAGAAEGRRILNDLQTAIQQAEPSASREPVITEQQQRALKILELVYAAPAHASPDEGAGNSVDDGDSSTTEEHEVTVQNIATLSPEQRRFLVEQLGWFGELALHPPGTDDQAGREAVLQPAKRVAMVLVGATVLGGLAAFGGFVGLIVLIVLAIMRALSSRVETGRSPAGIYAETFAVWMLIFLALQVVAGAVASAWPEGQMLLVFGAFVSSLVALAWPVWRGIPFGQVRREIGLTLGRNPVLEIVLAPAGNCMALPLLIVGVILTFGLIFIQGAIAGTDPHSLQPSGGPAHPIIIELTGPALWPKIQVLLVASIAAPLVEETMFRGVLYQHLRGVTRHAGLLTSVFWSATISGFLFAVIHPPGWVAVPALMSLAYAFALMREWRGTLLPSMIMHGLHNGALMIMVMVLLSG